MRNIVFISTRLKAFEIFPEPENELKRGQTKPPAVTEQKTPSMTEPEASAKDPGVTGPKPPAMPPSVAEPEIPGKASLAAEPKCPAEAPAMTEFKCPTKDPAMTSAVFLFRLVTVFTFLHPALVAAPITGIPASANTFPYIAGLIDEKAKINFIPFCTGTILTAQWVLTTYGCIKRPGRGDRRRDNLQAYDIILIFGTGFTPTRTWLSGKWLPNFDRYPNRRGAEFVFPLQSDLEDAFDKDPDLEEIKKSNNEYIEVDRFGNNYTRYYIDFAAVKLEKELKWTDQVVPAIYPLQGKRLTRTWWNKKVHNYKNGIEFMEPCYLVGWGGWDGNVEKQMRLRCTQVRYVPYENCELSYCAECSYCNKTWRVEWRHQTCYKSLLYADACLEDEGSPVWCPWAGITTTRRGQPYDTGAVLGLLSYATSCHGKSVPSIYSNIWQAFQMISRAVGYEFPPNILVFENVLEDPPEDRKN